MEKKSFRKRLGKGVAVAALTGAMTIAMAGIAFADPVSPYWPGDVPETATDINGYTTSYGVRAGSAGPDFLGISGTNFDFSGGSASQDTQYDGYTAANLADTAGAGLAIWATSVNESVNPYYANLYYNTVTGQSAPQATTWMKNEDDSSWGDSFGATSTDFIKSTPTTDVSTINGLEYEPNIIFGDAKYVGWNNYEEGTSYIREYLAKTNQYTPDAYVNNDATNIWTQVYSMNELAKAADVITGTDLQNRYGDAKTSAVNYEKAIKGNMLYIASQIDDDTNNIDKKTVAYLYAIDENGTGYFFTPQADNMLCGNDTGKADGNSETNADTNYAANNGTINLGYMGVLPFITNTFDSGVPVDGGIVMKVEDIYKANPACKVETPEADEDADNPEEGTEEEDSDTDDVLANVDVIIYNTTTATNLDGTSGGKNSSGINNDYYDLEDGFVLTDANVRDWAEDFGFEGNIVAGDDFGTSTNQGYDDIDKAATDNGMAPLLYCQRNYTADKNARAAWAFSQVYPELYNSANDSYCYWVDNIYHVNIDSVPTVVQYMTNQSGDVTYNTRTADEMENHFTEGLNWWNDTGKNKPEWNQYEYYNGSSRASYYSGNDDSAEETDVIGIFTPNLQW